KDRDVTVKLDEMSPSRNARASGSDARPNGDDKAALGISVAPLTPELAAREGLPRDAHGVLVQDVDPNGRAADAGIQPGDVIQEVNRQPVRTVDELKSAVKRTADRPVL